MFHLSLAAVVAWSALSSALPQQDQPQDWRAKIKNVVVLVEENRSFDNFAGGLTYNPSIDGLVHRKFCNPSDLFTPHNSTEVCAAPTAHNVAPDDPDHAITGVNLQLFSTYSPDEHAVDAGTEKYTMQGFVTEQATVYKTQNVSRSSEVINYLSQEHVPVFADMAENFVLFDRWFAAVPGPTNPNRAYITSGTSHGHGKNDNDFNIALLPQRSIFQQLSEKGISWINYSNTSGFNPDSFFYTWTSCSGAARNNIKPLTQFYDDAKAGTLPQFTYINPECCSYDSFHPPSPISTGELFIKKIYEALRASPQWEETLFILTFDEHGGFADHVTPPINVPAGDSLTYTEKAPDGKKITFDFTRLGVRVPTLLISPWVGKGAVEHKGCNNGGEYTHTSILGFLSKLWNLDTLTPRVAWSSTFEHLITNTMRKDTPTKLVNPVPF